MLFAIKRYVLRDEKRRKEHYKKFADEIKILFKASYPNDVRIYNSYLYSRIRTGYLQMEYIGGYSGEALKLDYCISYFNMQ